MPYQDMLDTLVKILRKNNLLISTEESTSRDNAKVNMLFGHAKIHDGKSFECFAVDTSLALDEELIIAFRTDSGAEHVHIISNYSCGDIGHFCLNEDAVWDPKTGSLVQIFNQNRNLTGIESHVLENVNTSGFQKTNNAILNPTTTASGTCIFQDYEFADKKTSKSIRRAQTEIILKPGTNYEFIFHSDTGGNSAFIRLNWYESDEE